MIQVVTLGERCMRTTMIEIGQQIKVIDRLSKQASEASYDKKVLEYLEVRELVLQGLLDDLRDKPTRHLVGKRSSWWDLIGDSNG